MKQHLPTAVMPAQASAPARRHVHPRHHGISLRCAHVLAGHMNENAAAGHTKRNGALGTDGIWRDTAFARIAPVFAPYHQRPKDAVT